MNNFLKRLFCTLRGKLFARYAWHGSTLQVIAAIVLPLTLLLVIISFSSFYIHQNAMRSMVGERDERAVRAAASAIDSEIHHRIDSLRGLTLLTGTGSKENLEHVLTNSAYLLDDFDYGLAFFSRNNELLMDSGNTNFWNTVSKQVSLSAWTRGAQMFQGVKTLKLDGKPIILAAFATTDGNIVTLGAFSAVKILQGVLGKDFPENGNAAVYVFDQAYTTVFQSGPGTIEGNPAHHAGIPDALSGKSGATYVQVGSDEHVLAYSPVLITGWAVIIEESWEVVANPTLQTSQITPMILIPALLLAVLALWFGAEQIVKPLRSLEAKAAKLAWGDFKEIEQPVQGIAEIRHLQTELVHMAHRVQTAQQNLHSYIGAITQGQEDERQRLARDLHDDTIQSLIALKQRAQLTRLALPKDTPLQSLAELETLTEQSIENLRRTIRALRPIYLEDFGLAAALEMLVNEAGQNSALKPKFHITGDQRRLTADVELALYRMVQETLNNMIRHAHATQASVMVEFNEQAIQIKIIDNGLGFEVPKSPAEFVSSGHFGLAGLYERAQLIGAILEIISIPGKGTNLSIYLANDERTS
ncbi:MAG: histidine kinase [Chloroflexota bacterium]